MTFAVRTPETHSRNRASTHRHDEHTWVLVLAGGEGTRLRKLTTTRTGTSVPKQFCSLAGGHTLLEEAMTRARQIVPDERLCVIVAQRHRRWWSSLLAQHPGRNVIVQPRGKGTGIGVLYSALHIAARDPQARILVLPSDHHVQDEATLRSGLQDVLALVDRNPRSPVLLGLQPDRIDADLGYIVPGADDASGGKAVARFIEKPNAGLAASVVAGGALWNTFIFAASVQALVSLFMQRHAPLVLEMQVILSRALENDSLAGAWSSLVDLYERLPVLDFSTDLLQGHEANLRVLEVPDCGWSDLGTPGRVAETLRRLPVEHTARRDVRETPFISLAAQHALYEHRADTAQPSL